jgi:hypothetical protein
MRGWHGGPNAAPVRELDGSIVAAARNDAAVEFTAAGTVGS